MGNGDVARVGRVVVVVLVPVDPFTFEVVSKKSLLNRRLISAGFCLGPALLDGIVERVVFARVTLYCRALDS